MRNVAMIAVLGVGLVLTGCVPDSGPVAFAPESEGAGDALFTGTLRITEECLTVDDGTHVVIPVFPAFEARYDDGVLTFGSEYQDGDEITLGGGEAAADGGIPDDWYVPAGCPDLPLWKSGPYLRPS
ncbi:hypothetical protein [Microbacterium sp. 2FI]|uniref:hypothetical protein n=1 Tax=Microbacterium sp. 2FI TaxID=2502193 RepID=UPI0010F5AA2C|nr:hypothetical protein [Microbacterium sp. 2FI]